LFFGQTKQVLEYVDKDGNKQTLEKVEPFHQLIVDVHPSLYEALDSYFNHHLVVGNNAG
jgi:uncharacterized protein YlbG (UPF0298 family)